MQTINIKNLLRLGKQQELRPLHFVLANRNKRKFGEIDNVFNVQYHPQLQTSELSFTIYKTVDDKECRLWDKITQRRLLWVKEYQEWFEISVDVDDSEKVIKKNITATALCKAELSQINLDNTEINTEADIARSDYEISTFCNFDNPNASILHRLLKKVPNYKIKHVDETLYNIQRSFSIGDDTKIYDFLTGTLSEEIGCLFLFDSNERGIYVYDMETGCLDCGYRDENDFDICPECGKNHIHKPYGQDTAVFVSKDNLGENIQLTSNAEEVKNCFKVTGGDDKINAAIINNNPNGTNTIYVFDEDTRKDMPDDLVSKIDEYDDLIEEYRTTHTFTISENAVTQYNSLISKINSIYTDKFSFIADSYSGYSNIITKYYDTFDLELYLESSMMPAWEQSDKTAQSQIELVKDELKSVSVRDVSIISKSTADNAVLLMVKAIIDTGIYKAEIKNSSLSSQIWTGQIILTNYSDEEDNASSDILTIEINDDYTSFVTQCLQKAASKTDTAGIKELFNIQNISDFKSELKKYCLSSLKGFLNAYQSALDVLVNENISNEDSEFYNNFYVPYYEKLGAVEYEIYIREADLSTVSLIQTELQNIINDTQKNLDFENYLGDELWQVFLSYRREDNYSNENYISDGLTNEELIQKANELTQTAYKELIKSSTKQYTITGTLHNLLLIKDDEGNQVFAPILEDFTLGNFIRCKIDGIIYRMRILDVTIDYDNLNSLSITFGDVTKGLKTLSGNISDIIKQSNSIAKSYSAVKRQAKQGEDAGITLNRIKEDGLNSAQYNVFNTFSTFVLDEHGLLGRNYYDVTDQYTPEQLRITGNNIVMTDNNWLSTKLAIGKQSYTLNGNEHTAYGVIADTLVGSQIIGSDIYSDNYTTDSEGNVVQGFNFSKSGDFNLADGRFSYNQETNILKLKGVTLDWTSSNTPAIGDIDGLDDMLSDLTDSENTAAEEISNLKTTVSSHESQISSVQGQIESKVWQQDITTAISPIQQDVISLSTKYTDVKQTTDGLSATVASHTTQISSKAENSDVIAVNDNVTSLTADLSGFKTTVSSTYTTKTEFNNVQQQVTAVNTIATQTADKFNWLVSSGTSASDFTLTDRVASLTAQYINLNGLVEFNGLDSSTQNLINISDKKYEYIIDLTESKYNQDIYYPVIGNNFDSYKGYRLFEVRIRLDSGSIPTWSTHPQGFSCNLLARMKASGWGAINNNMGWIEDNSYTWCSKMPAYISQMIHSSIPVFYLRGGGKYKIYTDHEQTWSIKSEEYTYRDETVEPTTSPNNWTRLGDIWADNIAISNWCYNNDRTYINGGKIYTGSITTNALAANSITGDKLNMTEIFSRDITATNMNIEGGTIGGWKISTTDIYDSTSSLQAGIGKNETSPAFWAGTSYNNRNNSPFRVNHDGSVYADKITLTGGTIGGWKITETDIYNDVGNGSAGIGTSGGRFAFWAGASYEDYTNAKFRVTHSGDLYASSANITGEITATSGQIGRFTISNEGWLEYVGDNGVCGLGATQAIYAGSTNSSAAPFHVSYDGSLYSTKGTIGGWKITETELVGNTTSYGTTTLSPDGQIHLFAYGNSKTSEFYVSPGYIYINPGANSGELILFGRSFTSSMIDKLLELSS